MLRELSDCKDKIVFFNPQNNWTVLVLLEEERILTCFLLDEYDLYLRNDCLKGSLREVNKNGNSEYSRFIKEIQDRC